MVRLLENVEMQNRYSLQASEVPFALREVTVRKITIDEESKTWQRFLLHRSCRFFYVL
jgi:hypothetical protein